MSDIVSKELHEFPSESPSATVEEMTACPDLHYKQPDTEFSILPGWPVLLIENTDDIQNAGNEGLSSFFNEPLAIETVNLDVTASDLHLTRLQTLRDILSGDEEDDKSFLDAVAKKRQALNKVFNKNLTEVMAKQRPVEKAWRELGMFYKMARYNPGSPVDIEILNSSVKELIDNDVKFGQFYEMVPKESELNMNDLIGLIVLPGAVQTDASLKKFGELAQKAKAHVFIDAPDGEFERVKKIFKSGLLSQIKRSDVWRQHVSIIANPIRLRKKDPKFEADGDDLYISPASVLAAAIVKGDDTHSPAIAQAGDWKNLDFEDPNIGLKWELTDREKIVDFKDSVIPLMYMDKNAGRIVAFGVDTLSDDEFFKQYNVVRVREYIEKRLIQFLNREVFKPNDEEHRSRLKLEINRFLRANSGQGKNDLITDGICTDVVPKNNKDGSTSETEIDIVLDIYFRSVNDKAFVEVNAKRLSKDGKDWRLS